ncbi:hypothetical protein GGU10DRAFT_335752 [Lentinula aff. detonsa]|uniref:Fungal-type protein kinase domain-containing protein n=1 Tax=Lentinula aff. detonsa TaxID=2804958 RepID=A0AA38NBW4_9AGAR|nr:hypothetical protein GGU10DRAFT_335752 [Lentinula aff. detonsa]
MSELSSVDAFEHVTASQPRRFHTPEPATQPPTPPTQQSPQLSESSLAQAQPISFHTPAKKIKAAASGAFRSASNVEERRTIIVSHDVPKMIPEISLQDHLNHIWPPLPQSLSGQVDNILKILEDNGTIDIPNNRWVAFPVDPAQATGQEGAVFQGLTTIFNAVLAAAQQIDSSLEQTFGFTVNGNVAMYSDRGVSSRPDGFNKIYTKTEEKEQSEQEQEGTGDVVKQNAGGKPPKNERYFVYDLANPHQFKLGDAEKDGNDDFAKLVYDMEQILALDPCRRFTFGTTIENCTTRLWFLSRATLLRTEPFDFMKDRRQLVRIFLSLAFSSRDRMGWDSTITLSHVDRFGQRQYLIKINDQSYTTVDVLSDTAADSPLGRATRVWKVKDSSAKIRVLKDVWLESDRLEEHKIREAILADAKALNEEDGYDAQLEKRMLRPMAYWRVPVGDEEDDTGSVMLDSYDLGKAQMVNLITPKKPPAVPTQSVGMSMPSDKDFVSQSGTAAVDQNSDGIHRSKRPRPQRTILDRVFENDTQQQASLHHRYHYRIVFEQCATTIHDERSLSNVFRAIVEVVKAGWVHRDISSGNVYWFDDDHTGLIGDFEYATRMTDRGRHNVRTGTPFFMAAETLVHRYLFTPGNRKLKDNAHKKIDFDLVKKSVSKTRVAVPIVPFAHNPLHDLESVWWIIVYVLFFNDDDSKNANDPMRRQMTMHELFHGRLDVNDREVFLRDFNRLPDAQSYLPPSFSPALEILTELAEVLTTAYINSEKKYPAGIDEQYFMVHNDFLDPLLSEEYMDSLGDITLVQVKENSKKRTTSEVERTAKRSR